MLVSMWLHTHTHVWDTIPFSMHRYATWTPIIVLYIGQDTECIANCYVRMYIECYSRCYNIVPLQTHASHYHSLTRPPQLSPRITQSPAVHTTTMSSGVSSMSRRLLMGLSALPPSWAFRASTSCCHFCRSSQGMIYIWYVKENALDIYVNVVYLRSLTSSCLVFTGEAKCERNLRS